SLSVRALQTLITYAKAMAYFRGRTEVSIEDVAAVLPFALRGKLLPNPLHPRFDEGADRELVTDSISWLADLFEQSRKQFAALGLARKDEVGDLLAEFARGLDGLSATHGSQRLTAIESQISRIAKQGKLYGRLYDDLLALKYLHQRYTNYLQWLEDSRR
ncbi:MAG: ATPase, partial [Microbacteriaceae bacterium]|nr:ATPase [Microbacteriaceae bacterium]